MDDTFLIGVRIGGQDGEALSELLRVLPGVAGGRGRWTPSGLTARVAWHGIPALIRGVTAAGGWLQVTSCPPDLPTPGGGAPDEEIRERLSRGELLPAYRDTWPMPHQRDGLAWAAARRGAMLRHPTGSGKTWTAIAWIASFSADHPAVIVTRASTRTQYAREVERFTSILPFALKPAGEVRKKDRWPSFRAYLAWCDDQNQRPVVVVGWESLPDWVDELQPLLADWLEIRDPGGMHPAVRGLLVLDESQKGKSKDRWGVVQMPEKDDPGFAKAEADVIARRGKVVPDREVSGAFVGLVPAGNVAESVARLSKAAGYRLSTTATPVDDRTRDLWAQLDLLEPWGWGGFSAFAKRYCDAKPGAYGGLDASGSSHEDELRERLGMVMHSVSSDVVKANLPAKRRQTWYIPHGEQVRPSGGWERILKAAAKAGPVNLLETRLAMAASAKRGAIIERIKEYMAEGFKVVVFTARREDCEELSERLRALKGPGAPKKVWSGHGGDSHEDRMGMKEQYMAHPGACVLVGTGQAWGTGIDGLQCTDVAIFALLPYTPGQLDQWEGRFTRLGQDRPVTILYPIAEGTADDHLADILLSKLPAVEALVGIDALAGAEKALSGRVDDPAIFAQNVLAALNRARDEGL